MAEILHFETIADLAKQFGVPAPEHPLFTIAKVEEVKAYISHIPKSFTYGFYAVGFKKNLKGYAKYGRRKYDFQEGVLSFTAPNQLLSFDALISAEASGWYLFFHKEILRQHPLIASLSNMTFFHYEVHEALHLSQKEERFITPIFESIYHEYSGAIDPFSREIIASNLDLLFTYTKRFYSRQVITREDTDSDFFIRFEEVLTAAFEPSVLQANGVPRVSYVAARMNVSPNYLSDVLKTLTGKSTIDHIHFRLLEKAKERLLSSHKSIKELSYELGFEYPQYFSQFFKEKTKLTPTEFRAH